MTTRFRSLPGGSVQLLPASQTLRRSEDRAASARKRRPGRLIVAIFAVAAATAGGITAVHVTHASAASTKSAPPAVHVDPASDPHSTVNQILSAQLVGAQPTASAPDPGSLPELGVQR